MSRNGIAEANWVLDSSTDLIIGSSLTDERRVAAWNFFVETTSPNEFYVLMAVANTADVSIFGSNSINTSPANIPQIPSTILTVNQVG